MQVILQMFKTTFLTLRSSSSLIFTVGNDVTHPKFLDPYIQGHELFEFHHPLQRIELCSSQSGLHELGGFWSTQACIKGIAPQPLWLKPRQSLEISVVLRLIKRKKAFNAFDRFV